MRLEFINRLKGNEVLGKSILTSDGKILLRAGIRLNNRYVEKLKELGVYYIYIEDDRLDDIQLEDDRLTEIKQNAIKSMSCIVKNVYSCPRDLRKSLNVVEDLINYVIYAGDINKSLYDIKTYDNYTYVHSLDTCIMSAFLGRTSGFSDNELNDLGMGAILHDIGKVKIPCTIINKTTSLTDEEFEEIKRHPIYGEEILKKNMSIPDSVISAVLQHHERVDGTGYPYRLKSHQISKFAKIVCICDVYDAVSNDRSYRNKFSPNEAYELILAGSGNIFDQDLVSNFRKTFAVYPLGCCLKLSDGREGYVIKQNSNYPDRPVLRVLYDSETRKPIQFYEVDLLNNTNIVVESIV